MRAQRVIVGLSGGVDSAVAALLLKEQGWEVHGLFMSNWEEDDDAYCTAAQDFQDARAVAARARHPAAPRELRRRIPRARVSSISCAEQRAGRTPNPDVLCNREIKFGVALRHARRLGAARFATGHYARIVRRPRGRRAAQGARCRQGPELFPACGRASGSWRATLMPLGRAGERRGARARAPGAGCRCSTSPTAPASASSASARSASSSAASSRTSPGPSSPPTASVLGTHRGPRLLHARAARRAEIGGRAAVPSSPGTSPPRTRARNALIVVQGHDHPLLFSAALHHRAAALAGDAARRAVPLRGKVRYRQADQAGTARAARRRHARGSASSSRSAPSRPASTRSLYEGERCLGGAVIERTELIARHGPRARPSDRAPDAALRRAARDL